VCHPIFLHHMLKLASMMLLVAIIIWSLHQIYITATSIFTPDLPYGSSHSCLRHFPWLTICEKKNLQCNNIFCTPFSQQSIYPMIEIEISRNLNKKSCKGEFYQKSELRDFFACPFYRCLSDTKGIKRGASIPYPLSRSASSAGNTPVRDIGTG